MGRFEQLFEEALGTDGDRYRRIRSQIVFLKPSEVVSIEAKAAASDWRVRLQAEIFQGWRASSDQYEYIRQVAQGTEPTLEGEKYITGKPPIEKSAQVLIDLGSAFLPALLEILYKEPDQLTDYAFDVCTQAILGWNDKGAVPVYRELLRDPSASSAYRESSIQPLLALEAESLYEDLMSIYEDGNNPLELRATSLASLGSLEDDRVIPVLEAVLKDPQMDIRFRCASAQGLGDTQNPAEIDLLAKEYTSTESEDFKESIILALGAMENSKAIGPLKEIRSVESDSGLMEIIDETLEDLEDLE